MQGRSGLPHYFCRRSRCHRLESSRSCRLRWCSACQASPHPRRSSSRASGTRCGRTRTIRIADPAPTSATTLGLPINDAARLFAESWDASRLTLQEHQCRVHVAPYIFRGPLHLRIWEEKDPETQQVVAIKNYISTYEQTRTIWMDGRPHPSAFAPHTFMGFSTGVWEGDTLTVTTTHLKQGWLRRNGVPESDQTTVVEHFIRHGQYFTHVAIISDPVYLAEPMIRIDRLSGSSSTTTARGSGRASTSRRSRASRRSPCRITCRAKTRSSRSTWRPRACPRRRRAAVPRRSTPTTWPSWRGSGRRR